MKNLLSLLILLPLAYGNAFAQSAPNGGSIADGSAGGEPYSDAARGAAGIGVDSDVNPGAGQLITDHPAETTPSLNSGYVEAPSSPTINALPQSGTVTLHGTVQEIRDSDNFILNDNTGLILVRLSSDRRFAIGESVTVVGRVDRTWEGTRIIEAAAHPDTIYVPIRQPQTIIQFGGHHGH